MATIAETLDEYGMTSTFGLVRLFKKIAETPVYADQFLDAIKASDDYVFGMDPEENEEVPDL